jgi:GNAT superfamily N-acetyltransferase
MKIINLKAEHSDQFKKKFDETFAASELFYGNTISKDFLTKRLFKSSIFPSDFSKIVITDNGKIGGFAIANLRRNPGQKSSDYLYLNLFFIAPEFQNQGLGTKLIKNLLKTAKERNKKGMITSLQWCGIWSGLLAKWERTIKFCKRTGGVVQKGEIFLEYDLFSNVDERKYNLSLNKNFEIRAYDKKDLRKFHLFVSKNFGIGWTHEALRKVSHTYESFNGYGLAETYDPGDVWMISKKNDILGFCVVQSGSEEIDNEKCFFGPIGIAHELRGKGLGGLLFFKAANYLRGKGKKVMGFWTDQNLYFKFYKKFGIKKTHETVNIKWPILKTGAGACK